MTSLRLPLAATVLTAALTYMCCIRPMRSCGHSRGVAASQEVPCMHGPVGEVVYFLPPLHPDPVVRGITIRPALFLPLAHRQGAELPACADDFKTHAPGWHAPHGRR